MLQAWLGGAPPSWHGLVRASSHYLTVADACVVVGCSLPCVPSRQGRSASASQFVVSLSGIRRGISDWERDGTSRAPAPPGWGAHPRACSSRHLPPTSTWSVGVIGMRRASVDGGRHRLDGALGVRFSRASSADNWSSGGCRGGQGFVKVVKNKSYFKRFQVSATRRQQRACSTPHHRATGCGTGERNCGSRRRGITTTHGAPPTTHAASGGTRRNGAPVGEQRRNFLLAAAAQRSG